MQSCKISIRALVLVVSGMLLLVASLYAAVGDGLWMTHVPEKARSKQNPFDSNPTAQAAGAKLFAQNCELEWLLTNGSMKNGMPSWSRLPEQQRWQLVSFLKSLQ